MEIAVISDLHIGYDNKTDQFKHDDFEFARFLKHLENNFEKIVLLGDIYETLMPTKFGNKDCLLKCLSAHPEVVKRFSGKQYKYVHGNHDMVAASVLKAPDELSITLDGKKLLFHHGHQYDGLINTSQFISEFGVWLGGWILRLGLYPVYKLLSEVDVSLEANIITKFQKLVMQSAHLNKADVIITGHTHVAKKSSFDNKMYLNSGTCSDGKISFLSMDTKNDKYDTNISW